MLQVGACFACCFSRGVLLAEGVDRVLSAASVDRVLIAASVGRTLSPPASVVVLLKSDFLAYYY
jgi:hypothetical protein